MNRLITNYEAVYSSNGFSMSLDLFTTVRLPSLVIFTISWREFFCRLGQSAALTLHLAKWIENSSTNRARTIWVLRHPHVNWGNSIFKKKKEATSARQTAEWGMRMIQKSFPGLKDRFVYEERGERRICLKMMVLLYNMRARMVGINQIRNTYMRHLTRDANKDVFF
jgi:hypothetical protein